MRTSRLVNTFFMILLIAMIIFQAIPVFAEFSPVVHEEFLYEDTGSGIIITGYDGEEASLVLPSEIGGKAVIGVRSLGVQGGVEHITIPDDVHLIGNPFINCFTLKSINVSPAHPELCIIDGVLFSKDTEQLIRYPSERPGDAYTIPEGTRTIGRGAFCDCPYLTEIRIPDSVVSIDSDAFCLCTQLKSLDIPSGVTGIGIMAFGNSGLCSMDLSSCTITEIPDRLFYGCYQLKEVSLPSGISSIGDEAFAFTDLESFTLPAGIGHIGVNPFRDCQSLRDIRLEDHAQRYIYDAPYLIDLSENRLITCISTVDKSLTLPEVAEIGDFSFAANHTLMHLVIPSSVVRIGTGAFAGCSHLEDVLIQECTGLLICRQSFSDCASLTHVTILGDVSALEEDVFRYDTFLREISAQSAVVRDYCEANNLPLSFR